MEIHRYPKLGIAANVGLVLAGSFTRFINEGVARGDSVLSMQVGGRGAGGGTGSLLGRGGRGGEGGRRGLLVELLAWGCCSAAVVLPGRRNRPTQEVPTPNPPTPTDPVRGRGGHGGRDVPGQVFRGHPGERSVGGLVGRLHSAISSRAVAGLTAQASR
jgi:hypothetical protein